MRQPLPLPIDNRGPSLRIFVDADTRDRPDRVSSGFSPAVTLTQFYERFVLPVVLRPKDTSPRTLDAYADTMRFWARLTGDPPLGEVDDYTAAAFVEALKSQPGRKGESLAADTVRKHCRQAQRLLNLAGPRSAANRRALSRRGLFGLDAEDGLPIEPPLLAPPPAESIEVEDVFTLDEIRRWLDACGAAITPRVAGIPPGEWWRTLITYIYNTAVRIGTALAVTYSMHRLDERDLLWVHVSGEAIKGRKAKRIYVNGPAAEAMRIVRRPGRELVWPWPHHRSHLDVCRRKLLAAAGIPPGRRFGFHALRKAACTEIAEHNPLVAQKQAGHAGMAMTRDHYVHRDVVAKTMERLPQPRRKKTKFDPRQMELF